MKKMNPFNRVLWMLACVSAAMLSFSCTKAEEETEGANQIENKKQSVWAEEDLQPKEGEVTEDGQPVVMVFGATVNYAQKKQPAKEEAASGEQHALAESGDQGEGAKSHLGELVVDGDDKYYPNLWSKGDRVSINGVSSASLPEANITSGGKQARFPMVQWVEKYAGNWYVGYPADAFSFSAGTGTVTLPVKQTYVAGSYDPDAFIMVGKSDEQGLDFFPQVAPLRIIVPGASGTYFSKIRIEAVNGEQLSGTFSTDYNNEDATFTPVSGNSYVEMDTPNLEFGSSSPVFFVLPAITYERGLRIKVTRSSDGKEMVFSNTKSMTVSVGSMTALTSPSFTPTTAQTTPSLVEVTPSSFYVQWTSGVPANDYAKRWRIDVWTNAACTGDPLRTIEIYPKAGCWETSTTPLRFIVGRMTPGATYYVKVKDVGNDNSNTTPAEITLSSAPSTVEMPVSNITTTGVILREDFSEIGWSASYYNGVIAGGFYPPLTVTGDNAKPFTFVTTGDDTLFKTNSDIYGFSYDRLNVAYNNSRLANWLYYKYDYFMPGYIKMGTENNKGYLFTPAIPLASDKSAVVSVDIKAAKYDANSVGTMMVAVVKDVRNAYDAGEGTDGHFYRKAEEGFSWPSSASYLYGTMNFTTTAWSTQTVDGLCMSNGDRLIIGVPEDASASGGAARFNLASVTLTVTELDDVFVINNAATLESFRSLVAGGSTTLNARVDADVDASSLSWTPIDGYAGILDGRGHTISGLTKPFFATLLGTARGLTVNSTINYTTDVEGLGIIAQRLSGGTLANCVSNGSVTFCPSSAVTGGVLRHIAGMVGQATSRSEGGSTVASSITYCTNNATVTFPHNNKTNDMEVNVGGVVGYITVASTTNLTNTGAISVSINQANGSTARQCRVGGVIGCASDRNRVLIECTNRGNITYAGTSYGSLKMGGVGGWIRRGMQDCTNSGSLTISKDASVTRGTLHLGGLVGFLESYRSLTGSSNSGSVSNKAPNSASDIEVGGLCGRCRRNISGCSNSGSVANSGQSSTMAVVGGLVGYATTDTYESSPLTSTSYASCSNSGKVTESSSSSEVRVGGICGYADKTTDFSYCHNESTGTITVSGKTRTNVYVSGILGLSTATTSASDYATLSSALNEGSINISSTTINGGLAVGGVLAQANDACPIISGSAGNLTTNTGSITCTSVTMGSSSVFRIGGIWGWRAGTNAATVAYCTNSGDITGSGSNLTTESTVVNFIGGIVGGGGITDGEEAAPNMTVNNSSNAGSINVNVKCRVFIGGIIGSVRTPPSDCSNSGNITIKRGTWYGTKNSCIGGIVGYHYTTKRTFVRLRYTGTIHTGETSLCHAAGLIGYTGGDCIFRNCYVEGSISCGDKYPGLFYSTNNAQTITFNTTPSSVKKYTELIYVGTGTMLAPQSSTTITDISSITGSTTVAIGGAGSSSIEGAADYLSVVD